MTDEKNHSFLIRCENAVIVSRLSDEDAGKLFKSLFSYRENSTKPEFDQNTALAIAFDVLSMAIDRSIESYDKRCRINRENGSKGGRPKNNQSEKMETEKSERLLQEPKETLPYPYPNPYPNPKGDKKESANALKKKSLSYFPDNEELNRAFADYADMRRQIKKPLTDRAAELAIKKLRELAAMPFGDEMDADLAVKILEQSTMNSWQGLFPLKDQSANDQSGKGGGDNGESDQSRGQASDFYLRYLGLGHRDEN